MNRLFRASIVLFALSGPAFAGESMIIRTPFGGVRIEVPQPIIPRPMSPQYNPQQTVRNGPQPSFDCTLAYSFVAQTLCNDPDGPAADWELNAASWARRGTLSERASDAFAKAETEWVHQLENRCRDPRCVIDAYRRRAAQYRHDLHGLALAEAQSSLEERIQIHGALFDKGFMKPRFRGYSPKPDGEFGPNTRAAIKDFQATIDASQTGFLSEQQRSRLLETPEQTAARVAEERHQEEDKQILDKSLADADSDVRACYEKERPENPDKLLATDASVERLTGVLAGCEAKVAEARRQEKNKQAFDQEVADADPDVRACYEKERPGNTLPPTDANIRRLAEVLAGCGTKVTETRRQEKNKQAFNQKVDNADPDVKACYEKERPANVDTLPATDSNIQRLTGVLAGCEAKVAQHRIDIERERVEAEKWRKKIEEARGKGMEYAKRGDSSWSISGQYNEMTDTTDYTVNSQQSNESEALADVRGFCEGTGVTFTATLASKYSDHPISFRQVGDGIAGQRRVNDELVTDWTFTAREWSNRFEIVTLSFNHDDLTSAETTWRILATFETSMGPIMIRVPTFEEKIQRMIVECRKMLERTAARPHKVGS